MEKFKFAIYKTSFHGGGLISRHHTEAAAEAAARKYRSAECNCGCAAVVALPADLPTQDHHNWAGSKSPYAPTLG